MKTLLQAFAVNLTPLSLSSYLHLKEKTVCRGTFDLNSVHSPTIDLELSRTCLLFSIQISPNTLSHFALNSSETVSYRLLSQTQTQTPCRFQHQQKGSWTLVLSYRQLVLYLRAPRDCSLDQWDNLLRKFWNKTGFHEEFKPLRKIGKGASASVFEAIKLRNNQKVAVKAFPKRLLEQNPKLKEALLNQIKLMRIVSESPQENVLNLHQIYESQNSIYLVMDLCSGGMLHSKLTQEEMKMDSEGIKEVIRQLLRGLSHLHSKNMVHRDIKLNNILLRNKGSYQIVIADLGLGTLIDEENYIYTRCGTPGYVAPEILSAQPEEKLFNTNCDIFSVGSIFHHLLTGEPLFRGSTMAEVFQLNTKMDFDLTQERYSELNPKALSLLGKMLSLSPYERIGADEALRHEYLEKKERLQKCQSPVVTALPNQSTVQLSELVLQDIGPKKRAFRKASHI